jgi:hypothetical protein
MTAMGFPLAEEYFLIFYLIARLLAISRAQFMFLAKQG